MTGAKDRDGRVICSVAPDEKKQIQHIYNLFNKFDVITKNEVSYEEFQVEDADIVLVAFGSMTRNIKAAMKVLRGKGLKVGCIRPITLSPFPAERLSELSTLNKDFIVVEMNMGQMYKDVKYAINGNSHVDLINRPCGEWLSVEEIVNATENIVKKGEIYAKSI